MDNSVERSGETPRVVCTSCGKPCGERSFSATQYAPDQEILIPQAVCGKFFRSCVERWGERGSPVYNLLDAEGETGVAHRCRSDASPLFWAQKNAMAADLSVHRHRAHHDVHEAPDPKARHRTAGTTWPRPPEG
ncbi:hypothetical protein PLANTIT3_30171 [Plantibacter sp. T3]|nr:hypothetical protein PLANTIT3_30171 [Plantibacter sp. T3]